MMSAAQSQMTMEAKLGALQCHFTWDLDPHKSESRSECSSESRSKLFCLRDMLKDIGTEEGNSWLGHIYNLQGYIHCQLGFTEDAQCFFSKAAEAFRQIRKSDKGPWLVVNYGNLAWWHYQWGKKAESQTCLSEVDTLLKEYPSPSEDELHPEIYAEKAWTLMKFGKPHLATDYFQKAIRMQPDMVEWQTSDAIALVNVYGHPEQLKMDKMKIAKENDPDNLYLAALYLQACAKEGKNIQDEVRELAKRVLRKPPSSYSGIRPLLRLYRIYVSMDEAVDLAEEALEKHPDERHLKWGAANCYKWRAYSHRKNPLEPRMIDRAISLYTEVIPLYPHSSNKIKLDFVNIVAKLNHGHAEADRIYQDLLRSKDDLKPADRQMLYNLYAKHVFFIHKERNKSIDYHMKAAEIPHQSRYRESSIRELKKIKDRRSHFRRREIEEFLANLQD